MAVTHRLMIWEIVQAYGDSYTPRTPEEITAYQQAQSDLLETVVTDLSLEAEFDITGIKWFSLVDALSAINAKLNILENQADALGDKDDDLQNQIDALEARIETLESYHP